MTANILGLREESERKRPLNITHCLQKKFINGYKVKDHRHHHHHHSEPDYFFFSIFLSLLSVLWKNMLNFFFTPHISSRFNSFFFKSKKKSNDDSYFCSSKKWLQIIRIEKKKPFADVHDIRFKLPFFLLIFFSHRLT